MKILITGGAGFIGSHLSELLIKNGHEVIILDNLSYGYDKNLMSIGNFYQCDVRDKSINKYFVGVDMIFHLAGISSLPECQSNPYEAISVNVGGTANVLECCRLNKIKKVVFASTSAVYENNDNVTETLDIITPTLVYSLSKSQAEQLCASYNKCYDMDITILRFFNVYGPNMDESRKNPPLIAWIIKNLSNYEKVCLHSDGKQERDMIYVDDVIDLCEKILHGNCTNQLKIYNVGSGKTYSVNFIFDKIKTLMEKDSFPIYRNPCLLWDKYCSLYEGFALKSSIIEKEVAKYTLSSTNNAYKDFGWKSKISIDDGLQITIEKMKYK